MKKFFSLLAAVLFAGSMMAGKYGVAAVSSFTSGEKYVFFQNDHVLDGAVESSKLQITTTFAKTDLEGTESYVWTVEQDAKGWLLKTADGKYLANASKGNLCLETTVDKATVWTAEFSDGIVLLTNDANSGRFLGLNEAGNGYKAYAASNLATYAHDIVVYHLEEGATGEIGDGAVDPGTGEEEDEVCSVTGTGKWAFVESYYSLYTDGSVDINLFTTAGWYFDEEGYLYGEGAGAAVVFDIIPENQADLAGTYTVKDGTIDPKYCFIAEYATADDEEGTTYEIADGTITISLNAEGTAYTLEYNLTLGDDSKASGVVEGLCLLGGSEEQGIENVELTKKAKKVVVDGNVFVIRDNKMYNVTGTRVR